MKESEMKTMLEAALADDDNFKRKWAYAEAIAKLGSVEELEMARAIINANYDLYTRAAYCFDSIEYEIKLRKKWAPELSSVDEALARYPHVAERVKGGIGYKVALLAFSEFCSCDVSYTCEVLEGVIMEFESGANKVKYRCGVYGTGQWPRNHFPSVLAAMAIFTQRPCWVLRRLFLPEGVSPGLYDFDTVVFERR